MKPLLDAVVLTTTLNMGKAVNLYLLGGVIGLLLGITASILTSQTRRSEAAHAQPTDLKEGKSETSIASCQVAGSLHLFLLPIDGPDVTTANASRLWDL